MDDRLHRRLHAARDDHRLRRPRAISAAGRRRRSATGGNLAAPLLAQSLGGGEGTAGGDIALALFSAAAFATILAVVSGLVLASASTVAHDLWANVIERGDEDTTRRASRGSRRSRSPSLAIAGDAGRRLRLQRDACW